MTVKKDQVMENQADKDVDIDSDKWSPTPEKFDEFLAREEQLALSNISLVLRTRGPLFLKEIKDSTLHTSALVERALEKAVTSGKFQENKGKYSLVFNGFVKNGKFSH